MSRSSSDDNSFKIALTAMMIGVYVFWDGFKQLKLRRKMGDIPTSQISSAAIGGFVEINGKVFCDEHDFIHAPISNKQGVCFVLKIEKLVSRGKRSSWEIMNIFYSSPFLYVTDSSEQLAAIDLGHCDFQQDIFDTSIKFSDRSFDLPAAALDLLQQYKIFDTKKKVSFFACQSYRISEKVFKHHELLYILGSVIVPPLVEITTAANGANKFGARKTSDTQEGAQAIYEKARLDPHLKKKYDKDGNSKLDANELKQLQSDIQKKILSDYKISNLDSYLERCKLFFTMVEDHEKLFSMKNVFVSLEPEQKLSKKLLRKALLGLIIGPILFVFGLLLLLN